MHAISHIFLKTNTFENRITSNNIQRSPWPHTLSNSHGLLQSTSKMTAMSPFPLHSYSSHIARHSQNIIFHIIWSTCLTLRYSMIICTKKENAPVLLTDGRTTDGRRVLNRNKKSTKVALDFISTTPILAILCQSSLHFYLIKGKWKSKHVEILPSSCDHPRVRINLFKSTVHGIYIWVSPFNWPWNGPEMSKIL